MAIDQIAQFGLSSLKVIYYSAQLFSAAVPVWGEIVGVVVLGFIIAKTLNEVDEKYELSDKVIACIREGLKERQRIEEWNIQRLGYRSSLYGGNY